VIACLAQHIFGQPLDPVIQDNYSNPNLVGEWSGWASEIAGSGYYKTLTSYSDCGSFTRTDFASVTAQLYKEFTAIPVVWAMVDNLKSPLIDSQGGTVTALASITDAVNDAVATSSQTASVDPLAFSSDALWALASLPGFSEFGNPLNFLAGAIGIADTLNNQSDGTNQTQQQITTSADNLGNELQAHLSASIVNLDQVAAMLVSDWTKLEDAAENAANTTNSAADWAYSADDDQGAADALLASARRQAYETLFPLAYNLYRLTPGDAPTSLINSPQYTCTVGVENALHTGSFLQSWQPFASMPANFDGDVPVISGEGDTEGWTYAQSNSSFLTNANGVGGYPSQDLLNGMFEPYTYNGQQMPAPFNPLQFAVEAYQNLTANTTTVTHTTVSTSGGSSDTGCNVIDTTTARASGR
jgi:hypothetical protein